MKKLMLITLIALTTLTGCYKYQQKATVYVNKRCMVIHNYRDKNVHMSLDITRAMLMLKESCMQAYEQGYTPQPDSIVIHL